MKVSDDILNPPRKNVKQGIDIPVQGEPVMKSAGPIEPSPLSSNNPLPSELQSPAPKYDTLTDINKYMYGDDIKKLEAEEKDAEKRKRSHAIISSIGGGLSALSNLYFTTQGAPNVQQADYAGRFVKEYNDAKDKRERLKDQWKARMADAVRGDLLSRKRSEEIKAQQDREDAIRANALKRDDARYAGEEEYRKKRDTIDDEYRKAQFDHGVKQSEEGLKLRKEQLQYKEGSSSSKNMVTLLLDDGNTIDLPKSVIGDRMNIASIYKSMIEENPSFSVKGKAKYDRGKIIGNEPATSKDMLNAIGMNLAKSKAAQNALKQLAGMESEGISGEKNTPKNFNPPTEETYLGSNGGYRYDGLKFE